MATKEKAKLTYIQGRGRGEMIRLTCAAAGIELDETYLKTREAFLKLKDDGKLPYNQVPLLEIDGLTLVGSDTIVRYLGRRANLYGKTNADKARIDIVVMGAKDLFEGPLGIHLFLPNPEEEIENKVLPAARKYLTAFEKFLEENGTGFFIGDSLTIADILVFDSLTRIQDSTFEKLSSVLDGYPKCVTHFDRIASQPGLKEYLASPRRNPGPTKEYIEEVKKVFAWNSHTGYATKASSRQLSPGGTVAF